MQLVKKILLILLSVVTGATFLYSAWTKVLPIQPFEYTIVEYLHLPWIAAAILARGLTGLEATLGGLMVLHLYGDRKAGLKIAAGLLAVFSVYLVWLWAVAGNDINCGCFGDEIWMRPSVSLMKNGGMLLMIGVLWVFHDGWHFRRSGLLTSALFAAGIALPFILYPMAMGEPTWLKKDVYRFDPTPLYNPVRDDSAATGALPYPAVAPIDVMKGKHIIAFLSPTCPHCSIAARKMSLMRREDTTLPLLMVIGGVKSDLTEFWKETKAQNVPWMRLHRDAFLDYTGGRFPTIVWVQDGMVVANSTYNTMNQNEISAWAHNGSK